MQGLLSLHLLLVILLGFAIFSNAGQVGDACLADRDCGAGLHCDACGSRCSRIMPIDPKTIGKELPFNKYSWLTTHNSFALAGAKSATGSDLITFTNQQDTVTAQLKNGVRGLMLDMYDFEGDIWLCHSFGGSCYNFTAFQPAINVLKEIQFFLKENPAEVITIFIEDYVKSSSGLTKVFSASGLSKYLFPISKMPKNGSDWPILSDMISKNYRLLVFTSIESKEASEGIAYEWNYVVENQYGDDGMKAGSCSSRVESSPMNTYSKSLVLMNYFPSVPNSTASCAENSAPLLRMLDTCHDLSGNRWPNFIAVDFYKESDDGGASEAADVANGHLVCGCDNIAFCKSNGTFGRCNEPPPPPPPPKAASNNSPTGPAQKSSNAYLLGASSAQSTWAFILLPTSMILILLL